MKSKMSSDVLSHDPRADNRAADLALAVQQSNRIAHRQGIYRSAESITGLVIRVIAALKARGHGPVVATDYSPRRRAAAASAGGPQRQCRPGHERARGGVPALAAGGCIGVGGADRVARIARQRRSGIGQTDPERVVARPGGQDGE